MRKLNVEFSSTAPSKNSLWWVLSGLLLAVSFHQASAAWDTYQRARDLDTEIADLRRAADEAGRRKRELELQATLTKVLPYTNDAMVQARLAEYPWDRVLKSVESVSVPGVKMIKLEISAVDDVVTAEYEIRDNSALLQVINGINAGEPDTRWRLHRMQSPTKVGELGTATVVSRWR